jgi:YVTN family beta-propeller protein
MDWNETVVPVGKGDEGFDVSPDGRELWTANAQDGTLSIIDIARKTVTATLDAKIFGANRLKFTPDSRHVLISSLASGTYSSTTPHHERKSSVWPSATAQPAF